MNTKLVLLTVFVGMSWCYAMENVGELVKPKRIGIFSDINQRKQQEDFFYHDIVDGGHLYVVCDGHYCHRVGEHDNDERDGSLVSKLVARNFHTYFVKTSGSIEDRMKTTFKAIDEDEFIKSNGQCGSTAVVVFIKYNKAYFAHVGDSRAVLECGGKVILHTRDHQPNRLDEYFRIQDAGGIICDDKVNGFLSISRAIGDYNLSKNIIIAEPDYDEMLLTPQHKFLILATDGLWKFVDSDEAVSILHAKRSQGVDDMNLLAKMLGMFAIKRNSKDNITVMLIDLLS